MLSPEEYPDHITISCDSSKRCRIFRMHWNRREERFEVSWQSHLMSRENAQQGGFEMAADLELEFKP